MGVLLFYIWHHCLTPWCTFHTTVPSSTCIFINGVIFLNASLSIAIEHEVLRLLFPGLNLHSFSSLFGQHLHLFLKGYFSRPLDVMHYLHVCQVSLPVSFYNYLSLLHWSIHQESNLPPFMHSQRLMLLHTHVKITIIHTILFSIKPPWQTQKVQAALSPLACSNLLFFL